MKSEYIFGLLYKINIGVTRSNYYIISFQQIFAHMKNICYKKIYDIFRFILKKFDSRLVE